MQVNKDQFKKKTPTHTHTQTHTIHTHTPHTHTHTHTYIYIYIYEDGYVAMVEWYRQGKTEVLGEKPVTVPFFPPQIRLGLTWDRTRAFAVRGRRLTS